MINGILAIIGIVLLYVCWNISTSTWSRLTELGIEHTKSSTTYFDSVFFASLIGLVISRLSWMFTRLSLYQEVPWGVLPYSRSATEFVWFTVFPWRVFRITEGILFPALWGIMGTVVLISIFIPTIQLARKLRLEKRGIMRAFILRNAACAVMIVTYFSLLTYFAW